MVFDLFDLKKEIYRINNRDLTKLTKLNLGAGDDIRRNWFNHDQIDGPGIDCAFDLNETPYPLEDNMFELIYASHVLEHVTEIFSSLEEINRILKNDGLLIIRTPHYSSNCCYGDLSHRHATGYQTFQQLADADYCRLYRLTKWSSVEFCKLLFTKKWYYPWNYLMQPLANLKPIYFENTLVNIFNPFETVTILKK